MSDDSATIVKLEIKRVQTYLFEVPRLQAMVGANVLLGETLRGEFGVAGFVPGSLPHLATTLGSQFPEEFSHLLDNVRNEIRPFKTSQSLVLMNQETSAIDQDDPLDVAQKTGILVRDASRMHVVFPSRANALRFVDEARELLGKKLPGTTVAFRLVPSDVETDHSLHESYRESVFDLPQADVCEVSGSEIAVKLKSYGDRKELQGESTAAKLDAAIRSAKNQSHDILGLMRPKLIDAFEAKYRVSPEEPNEFEQIASSGYLAVIHADGNGVGNRIREIRSQVKHEAIKNSEFGTSIESEIVDWQTTEPMFYGLRSSMRQAVFESASKVFVPSDNGLLPFRLLMLGGDDLVLVCDAPKAFQFVVELATSLGQHTQSVRGGQLSLGVGIAIAKSKFPFHRAHAIAEQLASSAKRAKGNSVDQNVVDWLVTSETWYGDIESTRKQQSVARINDEQLILSKKPYAILHANNGKSLSQLLNNAKEIRNNILDGSAARSQLKNLLTSIGAGRRFSEFAVTAIPRQLRQKLAKLEYIFSTQSELMTPYSLVSEGLYATELLDLMEIIEVLRLEKIERTPEPTKHGIRSHA